MRYGYTKSRKRRRRDGGGKEEGRKITNRKIRHGNMKRRWEAVEEEGDEKNERGIKILKHEDVKEAGGGGKEEEGEDEGGERRASGRIRKETRKKTPSKKT